jgi:Fe-S-cluster formation regulator IscX/YfhJ
MKETVNMATCCSGRRFGLLGLAVLAVGLVSAEPREDNKVDIRVVAIVAHNRNEKIDPKLVKFAEELRKTVPQLKSFDMAKQSCKPVALGTSENFDLVDGQVACVTLLKLPDKESNLMRLKITTPQMDGEPSEVVYETMCAQYLPIITKYRTAKHHDVLIVAVCVRPCGKK